MPVLNSLFLLVRDPGQWSGVDPVKLAIIIKDHTREPQKKAVPHQTCAGRMPGQPHVMKMVLTVGSSCTSLVTRVFLVSPKESQELMLTKASASSQ